MLDLIEATFPELSPYEHAQRLHLARGHSDTSVGDLGDDCSWLVMQRLLAAKPLSVHKPSLWQRMKGWIR